MLVFAFLTPLAALWWMYLKAKRDKALEKLVAPALRARLMPKGANLWGLQAYLIVIGLFLAFIAAARPQWGRSDERMIEMKRNLVIAIDVSRSMLARDVRPNRLERAKADVADLIDSLEGDRASLVAFRRTGVVLCPLTSDHAFLRSSLEHMSPESAPRGETDLGAAIRASLDVLDPASDDHNAIILISDGGDLRGDALECALLARKRAVPIFTVGIGDDASESTIPAEDGRGNMKFQGEEVKTRLDPTALKAISEASNGRYVPLATVGSADTTLGAIYRKFLRQVAVKQVNEIESRTAERYQFFLYPSLVLLIAGASLSKGRFGRNKS